MGMVVCDYDDRPHPLNDDDRLCRNPRRCPLVDGCRSPGVCHGRAVCVMHDGFAAEQAEADEVERLKAEVRRLLDSKAALIDKVKQLEDHLTLAVQENEALKAVRS